MYKFLYSSILLLIIVSTEAQNTVPVTLYAQHNQTVFNSGEIIYSKIYARSTKGLHMQPLNIYVDWYTAEGSLLLHQVYLTSFGGTEASFEIPVNYPFSFLRMRMYTLESLMQLPEYKYFDQVIFINQKSNQTLNQLPIKDSLNTLKLNSDESISVKKIMSSFNSRVGTNGY